ncbi:hypothetical protein EON82_00185 [bacterium]|nr:MAG: hypothetical protein EON82_00185 [bacterium]
MTLSAPARVFGYVAAEADVCVLLRRGPSKWVLMVRWDLKTDEFEVGQWLNARVYEDQCDLSPDGQLFVYQANDGQYSTREFGGVYSVVSRPPYFTALAFWAQGSTHSTGFGWIAYPFGNASAPTKGTLPDKYRRRLKSRASRWGWSLTYGFALPALVRKTSAGQFSRKPRENSGGIRYELNGDFLDAQWADVDHRGRLLFAREGRIYVRETSGERELIDLTSYEFRPLEAPNWAKQWP